MSINDPLGNRMKGYESVSNYMMTHRLPVIVRIDGRAFSSLTKRMGFKKPFDDTMTLAMQKTALALCEEVMNCRLAYVQSDEISLLLIPYEKHETQPYFGNELQKITSITAGVASVHFTKAIQSHGPLSQYPWGTFDCRAFVMPPEDVENYFLWRQRDCQRNALNGVGQHIFGGKKLHGKNRLEVFQMVKGAGVVYEDFPEANRQGTSIVRSVSLFEKKLNQPIGPSDRKQVHVWDVRTDVEYGLPEGRELVRSFVFCENGDDEE